MREDIDPEDRDREEDRREEEKREEEERRASRKSLLAALLLLLIGGIAAWFLNPFCWRGGCAPTEPVLPVVYKTIFEEDCDDGGNVAQCFDVFYATTRSLAGETREENFGAGMSSGATLGKSTLRVPFMLPENFAGRGDKYCFGIRDSTSPDYEKSRCDDVLSAAHRIATGRQIFGNADDWEIVEAEKYFDEEAVARNRYDQKASLTALRYLTTNIDPEQTRVYAKFAADVENAFDPDYPGVLLYVHGFDTAFQNAALTAAYLAADLNVHANKTFQAERLQKLGVPVLFSWPTLSGANIDAYLESQLRADADAKDFERLIRELAEQTDMRHLNVIGHSMGNRLLLRALDTLKSDLRNRNGEPIAVHVVHAAADIGQADFADKISTLALAAEDDPTLSTIYISGEDNALSLSDWWAQGPKRRFRGPLTESDSAFDARLAKMSERNARKTRLKRMRGLLAESGASFEDWLNEDRCRLGHTRCGRFAAARPDFTTVDATSFETDLFDHNYYANAPMVLADISCALRGFRPESGRSLTQTGDAEKGRPVWALVPDDRADAEVDETCVSTGRLFLVNRKKPETLFLPEDLTLSVYFDVGDAGAPLTQPVDNDDKRVLLPLNSPKPPRADAAIAALAAEASGRAIEAIVIGYADRSGEAAENLRLSQQRANVVKAMLVRAGLPQSAIKAQGLGEYPATGDELRDRHNRRVDIKIAFKAE